MVLSLDNEQNKLDKSNSIGVSLRSDPAMSERAFVLNVIK
jgi:hypothetical protein